MLEIHDVVERCRTCSTATVFAILVRDLDESGEERARLTSERVPHGADICARQVALNREEWPCLF